MMRFENIEFEELDMDTNSEQKGNYSLYATDELIEVTNKIRAEKGNTDLVGPQYDNEVYYTHYLIFDLSKQEITLEAVVAAGEKDDFAHYEIELSSEEKELLLEKTKKELLSELEYDK